MVGYDLKNTCLDGAVYYIIKYNSIDFKTNKILVIFKNKDEMRLTYMKKRLLAMLLTVVMIVGMIPTYCVTTVSAIDVKPIAKYAIKGAVEYGAAQIPVVGPAASSILGAMVGTYLGVPSLGSISGKLDEIMEKLDQIYEEISAQIDEVHTHLNEMQEQLDQSTQEILNEFFKQNAFTTFDSSLTSLSSKTDDLYTSLAEICESSDTEEYKMLCVAELLSFDSDSTDSYANTVVTLSKYLDGNQISFTNKRDLYDNAFLAGCKDSLLGGEAATRVAPYLNRVNGTLSDSYRMILMVLEAKNYVVENLDDLKVKAKTNRKLSSKMKTLKDDYLDSYTKKKQDFTDKYHHYFNNDDDTSVVQKYNHYVENHWFDYIDSYTIVGGDAQVEFFPLDRTLNTQSVGASMWNIQKSQAVNTAVATGKATAKLLDNGFGTDKTKKLIEHLQNNENGVFVDVTGSAYQQTLMGVLEDYGFEIPKRTDDTIFGCASHYLTCGNILDDRSLYTYLHITGYDANQKVGYSQATGKPYASTVPCVDKEYYHYHYTSIGDQTEKNEAKDYTFLFFKAGDVNIGNEDDFISFIRSVAKGRNYNGTTIRLNSDLNLTDVVYEELWSGLTDTTYKTGFKGTFVGNGHTVTGLTDNGSGKYGAGLFRSIGDGANVSGLVFKDVKINAPEGNAGALAGRVYHTEYERGYTLQRGTATIADITVESGSVTAKNNAGGIFGSSVLLKLKVSGFSNAATIEAAGDAGGIVGYSENSLSLSKGVNTGNVTSTGGCAGGIWGKAEKAPVTLTDSKNSGNITAASHAGGILGFNNQYDVKLDGSQNSGVITAGASGGGIAGCASGSCACTAVGCQNTGNVTAQQYAGGIAGDANKLISSSLGASYFTDCKNSGDIVSVKNYSTGGITGRVTSDSVLCAGAYNKGSVTGGTTGGILGESTQGKVDISNCVNEGMVTGTSNTGGIAGYIGNKDRDPVVNGANCKNSGTVTGRANVAGIVGYLKTDANHDFNHCVNTGNVKSTEERGGGIIGYCCGGGNFTYCTNTARIVAKGKRDQIIAQIEDDKCDLTGCVCNGSVAAASILSEGSIWIVIAILLAAIFAAVVLLLRKKKKDSKTENSSDEGADENVNENGDENTDESADESDKESTDESVDENPEEEK